MGIAFMKIDTNKAGSQWQTKYVHFVQFFLRFCIFSSFISFHFSTFFPHQIYISYLTHPIQYFFSLQPLQGFSERWRLSLLVITPLRFRGTGGSERFPGFASVRQLHPIYAWVSWKRPHRRNRRRNQKASSGAFSILSYHIFFFFIIKK